MGKRVPKFVAEQYHGGASEFRRSKRHAIRRIIRHLKFLRVGSAFFPSGSHDAVLMLKIAERIKADISTRNWGK